jgi:hypothetical protein
LVRVSLRIGTIIATSSWIGLVRIMAIRQRGCGLLWCGHHLLRSCRRGLGAAATLVGQNLRHIERAERPKITDRDHGSCWWYR